MLRNDSSCYGVFQDALKAQVGIYKPLMKLCSTPVEGEDTYMQDKAAWLLSAVAGNVPQFFSSEDVLGFLKLLLVQEMSKQTCSPLGVLEAITNLLKADTFRSLVW